MERVYFTLLGIAAVAFSSCREVVETESVPVYAKTELVWSGASAEQLKEKVMTMPTLRMAIIWDERVFIYHDGPAPDVTGELEQAKSEWAGPGVTFGEVLWIEGMLPEPPPPVEAPKPSYRLDLEKMKSLGLTVDEVAGSLDGLEVSEDGVIGAEGPAPKLEGKMIARADGSSVALKDLIAAGQSEAWRPLIIDNRENP